jgi:SAM-dependent methyltransferase
MSRTSGAGYVEAITGSPSDRRARAAFQDLVVRVARPGAALFDFGAGPGLDARFYAERGFTVAAYDVDPEMREYFSVHCRELIQEGQVTFDGGTYQDFLASKTVAAGRGVELVTSNFAPLNLIENLRPLFAKFHAVTQPDGKVLASVLSPYFISDMRYGWWWRNAARLWRAGHFSLAGARGPIVRRRLADFAAQSLPYFTLERIFPGLPSSTTRDVRGVDMSHGGRHAWLHVTTCRYMFLLFRKREQAP